MEYWRPRLNPQSENCTVTTGLLVVVEHMIQYRQFNLVFADVLGFFFFPTLHHQITEGCSLKDVHINGDCIHNTHV